MVAWLAPASPKYMRIPGKPVGEVKVLLTVSTGLMMLLVVVSKPPEAIVMSLPATSEVMLLLVRSA